MAPRALPWAGIGRALGAPNLDVLIADPILPRGQRPSPCQPERVERGGTRIWPPFRANGGVGSDSQGVALGSHGGGPWTTAAAFSAYYGSIVSYRVGLDPDTYGIPIITAAVDLLGFMSLIISLVVFGLVE